MCILVAKATAYVSRTLQPRFEKTKTKKWCVCNECRSTLRIIDFFFLFPPRPTEIPIASRGSERDPLRCYHVSWPWGNLTFLAPRKGRKESLCEVLELGTRGRMARFKIFYSLLFSAQKERPSRFVVLIFWIAIFPKKILTGASHRWGLKRRRRVGPLESRNPSFASQFTFIALF